MLTAEPGGSEPGYLGFAIADALLDLLIAKGTITRSDAKEMLTALSNKLGKNGTLLGERCVQLITDGMPR